MRTLGILVLVSFVWASVSLAHDGPEKPKKGSHSCCMEKGNTVSTKGEAKAASKDCCTSGKSVKGEAGKSDCCKDHRKSVETKAPETGKETK